MTGKPQRARPKLSVHISMDLDVFVSVLPLLSSGRLPFKSKSRLVESILFLSEHMYVEEREERFIKRLVELQRDLLEKRLHACEQTQYIMHATLDRHVVKFLDMLKKRYTIAFGSRSHIAELLLFNVGAACGTADGVDYYCSRLIDVLALHP